MIRMVQSTSAEAAKSYYTAALSKADYYLSDQELPGHIRGRLADRLGVAGAVTRDVFYALCDNLDPNTGKPLTLRMKERRITGYDINFHCPKSVSIIHALSKDGHILKAFEDCVHQTMLMIEAESKTRVRKGGVHEDRETGELIWAEFTHQTARPVDSQAPDPHLHAHCFVFNATYDGVENKVKAGKFRDIKRDMPFYQAMFQKLLADRLVELGYAIRKTPTAFEINGMPHMVIDHFSKRTNAIGAIAKEKGITNKKELDALGAKTRGKKQKGATMAQLKSEWRKQIADIHMEAVRIDKPIRYAPQKDKEIITHANCINYALEHHFERASVVGERQLLKTAYEFSFGRTDLSIEAITKEFMLDERIIHIAQGTRKLCTTKEVLREEKHMIELALQGQNRMMKLVELPRIYDRSLKEQHKAAITHVMTSQHRVSIIRGAAGTGKTTMLKELDRQFRNKGKRIFYVAPTASASRDTLRKEGFKNAETVSKLLTDPGLQKNLLRQAILVDEAGLLGTRDMIRLLQLAKDNKARLILVGDTRQHSSVTRGDALRVLNTVGGIQTAEMSEILRQKNFEYKKVVEQLSKGNIKDAFEKLDRMEAIKTIDPLVPSNALVKDYLDTLKKKKTALVISPTHKQGEALTEEIRAEMRKRKMIGKREIKIVRYINLNMTVAEKGDWRRYEKGQVIQFNQNLHGVKRGSQWIVDGIKDRKVHLIDKTGRQTILPCASSHKFDVFEYSIIGLSKGDKIRITKNGFDKSKKKRNLDNGTTLDVMAVSKLGDIKLLNKTSKTSYLLRRDFGHIAHAHCITSYAAQGKTVDEVFIHQPADTFAATDAKQFYVSVSRGRDKAHIYTDDKEALLEAACELGNRQSALELVKNNDLLEDILQQKRKDYSIAGITKALQKTFHKNKSLIDKEYEPGS